MNMVEHQQQLLKQDFKSDEPEAVCTHWNGHLSNLAFRKAITSLFLREPLG